MKLGLSAFMTVLALLVAPVANAADHDFAKWLSELRLEAKERGVSDRILDAALGNAAPIKRVIELDRRQPEFTMSFEEYLGKIASPTRARIAAKMLVEHDEILAKVSKKYGVQKRYIVTFWGVETNFGQYLGSFNVPHALATLAFDGRRGPYFRKELLNALKILEEGHITPDKMKDPGLAPWGKASLCRQAFCPMLLIGMGMANAIYGARSPMCLPQPPITCQKQAGAMTLPGDGK